VSGYLGRFDAQPRHLLLVLAAELVRSALLPGYNTFEMDSERRLRDPDPVLICDLISRQS
jgi:hypothetical protein